MNLLDRLRIFGLPRLYVRRRGRRFYLHFDRWTIDGDGIPHYRCRRFPRWPRQMGKTVAIEPSALAENPGVIDTARAMIERWAIEVEHRFGMKLDRTRDLWLIVNPTEDEPNTLVSLKVSE